MTQAEELRAAPAEPDARQDRTRVEIQALRAVAVMLVLVYHLWP